MLNNKTTPSACCHYELKIEIKAAVEVVWNAIFEHTNKWWLPDFRVAGADSVITFDTVAGGRGLVEETPAGDWLLWYSVQMYQPSEHKVYLIGQIAPEWGGPTTSSLRLAIEKTESGCVLNVTDARHGNVDEQSIQSFADGWKQLFTDGLKAFAEQQR